MFMASIVIVALWSAWSLYSALSLLGVRFAGQAGDAVPPAVLPAVVTGVPPAA